MKGANVEKALQILLIEDDPADALRLEHELRKGDFVFECKRVETREEFLEAVKQPLDLVLSDHGLPSFSGFAALDIVQQRCPDVPFIFVTGSYDQAGMVEMFESGAWGYVYKNHLSDLGPTVRQALKEAATRQPHTIETLRDKTSPSAKPVSGPQPRTPERKEQVLLCSRCKKVLTSDGTWEEVAHYLRKNDGAAMTLALCPRCATARYPGLQF